jgi:hypothetical protein
MKFPSAEHLVEISEEAKSSNAIREIEMLETKYSKLIYHLAEDLEKAASLGKNEYYLSFFRVYDFHEDSKYKERWQVFCELSTILHHYGYTTNLISGISIDQIKINWYRTLHLGV